MRNSRIWLLPLLQLLTLTSADAGNWTKPNSVAPSFTDTYTVGERIFVSWLNLNNSVNDLWLTRYDTRVDTYAFRLLVGRNISYPDSYEWTIGVENNEVLKDTRFILQFLPTGSSYDPKRAPQLPSPAFNLILLNQLTLPNGTIGAPSITPSATSASSTNVTSSLVTSTPPPAGTPPSDDSSPFLSQSAAIGIAIAAVVLALGSMIAAFFVVRAYRRPKPVEVVQEEFKTSGPYEVLGNSRQPTELSSKETMVYEMNSPSIYECESPSVYEMSTTVKKPGLHELPG